MNIEAAGSKEISYFVDTIEDFIQHTKNYSDKEELSEELLALTHLLITNTKIACSAKQKECLQGLIQSIEETQIDGEETERIKKVVKDCLTKKTIDAETIASFVNEYQVPLKDLHMTLDELKPLQKHLQFLGLEGHNEDNETIGTFIKNCPHISTLHIADCPCITTIPELPESMEAIVVSNNPQLQKVTNFPINLKGFYSDRCPNLKEFPEELPSYMEEFHPIGCKELKAHPKLNNSLTSLSLSGCADMQKIVNLPDNLENLDLSGNTELEELPKLGKRLKHLVVTCCKKLKEIKKLPECLQTLVCYACPHLIIKDVPEGCEILGKKSSAR